MDEHIKKALEIKEDCERIIPALKAWFESQGVDQVRQCTACGVFMGQHIAKRASTRHSLQMGLTLFLMAVQTTAEIEYDKLHPLGD